uniref:RNA-dependent RNA polymerase n=1 Tax=Vittskovle virus TaxID=2651949 RepID=A0A5Q0TWD1_9VIRU|nr:RNA-dependent RNA polymerase [Vittskovle virus]
MARVFMPPYYKGVEQLLFKLAEESFFEMCTWAEEDMKTASWMFEDCPEWPEVVALIKGKRHGWANFHRSALEAIYAQEIASQHERQTFEEFIHNIVVSYDCTMHMFYSVASASGRNVPESHLYAVPALQIARQLSTVGLIASFATPNLAYRHAHKLDVALLQQALGTRYEYLLAASDICRSGIKSQRQAKHMRNCITTGLNASAIELEIGQGPFLRLIGAESGYFLGSHVLCRCNDKWLMIGRDQRSMLAETLWSFCMWKIIPHMMYPVDKANLFASTADYVVQAVRRRFEYGASCESLAAQMKSSYSSVLAMLGYHDTEEGNDAKELMLEHRDALRMAANELTEGECPFWQLLEQMTVEEAINWGCAWHLLPAPACDAQMLNDAIKTKYNAPRNMNEGAWKEFIIYSRGVISAHWLLANRHSVDPEHFLMSDGRPPHGWALDCLRGNLCYPPNGGKDEPYVERVIDWVNTMEEWHLQADDVTHIHADTSKYTPVYCAVEKELTWVVYNGCQFSTGHTPQQVRGMWRSGYIPGDRMLYAAAKCENTKYGDKVRETQSGDDIMRAILSEVDANMSRLAVCLDGIAMRAGRGPLEKKVQRIASKSGSVLLSLDVSGWSPNMVRKGEMDFIDMMMGFFKIPRAQTASCVFKDITVVMSRAGFFDKWEAKDGSIQGFFGTADTIMHSLMAQWAYSKLKADRFFPPNCTMAKVALIDDIACAFDKCLKPYRELIDGFVKMYALLGFTADPVKTIVSSRAFTFLNRVYYGHREVLTYAKIAAKFDREWERPFVSFFEEIDSIFGSMSGAVDRGLPVWVGYTLCCWRIVWRAMVLTRNSSSLDRRVSAWAGLLPRQLGGWGIPSAVNWVTKNVADPLSLGLSSLHAIARKLNNADNDDANALCGEICAAINSALNQPLNQQSEWAVLCNPSAVYLRGTADPAAIIRNMVLGTIRKCSRRISPEIAQLLDIIDNEQYQQAIVDTFKCAPYPVEVVEEIMACLPHEVMGSMLAKLTASEWATKITPYRIREAAHGRFAHSNLSCILYHQRLNIDDPNDWPLQNHASSLCEYVRTRQREINDHGLVISNLTKPSITDLFTYVPDAVPARGRERQLGMVRPAISIHGPRFHLDDLARTRLVRTVTTPKVIVTCLDNVRLPSVTIRCYVRVSRVVALLESAQLAPTPIKRLWVSAWLGPEVRVDWPKIETGNLNVSRLLSTSNYRSFSCAANPNIVTATTVDMSAYLEVAGTAHVAVPHMAINQVMKAFLVVDCEMGAFQGLQRAAHRGYNMVGNAHLYKEPFVEIGDVVAPQLTLTPVRPSAIADIQSLKYLLSEENLYIMPEDVDTEMYEAYRRDWDIARQLARRVAGLAQVDRALQTLHPLEQWPALTTQAHSADIMPTTARRLSSDTWVDAVGRILSMCDVIWNSPILQYDNQVLAAAGVLITLQQYRARYDELINLPDGANAVDADIAILRRRISRKEQDLQRRNVPMEQLNEVSAEVREVLTEHAGVIAAVSSRISRIHAPVPTGLATLHDTLVSQDPLRVLLGARYFYTYMSYRVSEPVRLEMTTTVAKAADERVTLSSSPAQRMYWEVQRTIANTFAAESHAVHDTAMALIVLCTSALLVIERYAVRVVPGFSIRDTPSWVSAMNFPERMAKSHLPPATVLANWQDAFLQPLYRRCAHHKFEFTQAMQHAIHRSMQRALQYIATDIAQPEAAVFETTYRVDEVRSVPVEFHASDQAATAVGMVQLMGEEVQMPQSREDIIRYLQRFPEDVLNTMCGGIDAAAEMWSPELYDLLQTTLMSLDTQEVYRRDV